MENHVSHYGKMAICFKDFQLKFWFLQGRLNILFFPCINRIFTQRNAPRSSVHSYILKVSLLLCQMCLTGKSYWLFHSIALIFHYSCMLEYSRWELRVLLIMLCYTAGKLLISDWLPGWEKNTFKVVNTAVEEVFSIFLLFVLMY